MNWLLIATIAIIAWCMVSGYMRGMLRIAYSFVSWILVMGGSAFAAPYLRAYIEKHTHVKEEIYKIINQYIEENTILTDAGYSIADIFLKKTGMYNEISHGVTQLVMNLMAFFLVMSVLGIIFGCIGRLIWGIEKLPVIGAANRIIGMIIGFMKGMVIVWLVFLVLAVISTGEMGNTVTAYIEDSVLLKLLYNHNPIMGIIMGINN